jgi:hypothetical protein
MYSFSGNCAASVPIFAFICLWAIYIFPGSVHIFPVAEKADRWWEYINRSQTHECWNWNCGRAIPFLGTFSSFFCYWFFAACVLPVGFPGRFGLPGLWSRVAGAVCTKDVAAGPTRRLRHPAKPNLSGCYIFVPFGEYFPSGFWSRITSLAWDKFSSNPDEEE